MKKTKSLDHQLSSEANDYDGIDQVDYELDSREELGRVQDSITSADTTTNGHISGHVTLRKHSYEEAIDFGERVLGRLQERVGSDDGLDTEVVTRQRYRHDTELLPVGKSMVIIIIIESSI